MDWRAVAVGPAAFLSGCSPLTDAALIVEADEPIEDAWLVLNGEEVQSRRVSERAFMVDWNGSEASGEFRIRFRDGAETSCSIGYLEGNSFYDEKYEVIDRQCEPVPRAELRPK